uniref:autotransporter outer membrane beta-barrel domain-containing protein n=1 Tax=Anaerovibrio lipolyticus TaxID=82374 RepID=UPI0026EEA6AE
MKKLKSNKLSKKREALLTALIFTGCMVVSPISMAEESPYLSVIDVKYDTNPFAQLAIMRQGCGIGTPGKTGKEWLVEPSKYNLAEQLINGTEKSTSYWSEMLGPGAKNTQPWQIFVNGDYDQNAYAMSISFNSDGKKLYNKPELVYTKSLIEDNYGLEALTYENAKTGVTPAGNYGYSNINVGAYTGANREGSINGWWVDADTVLPTNEQSTDYVATFRHELAHALGFFAARDFKGKDVYFVKNITDQTSWTMHLYDQNGNPAKGGMQIVTTQIFNKLKKKKPDLQPEDFFIVDDTVDTAGYGYAYFSGEHVLEALDGAKFFGVSGLPVNGWESTGFDGSHLQTAGMMSHRLYSNYTSLMEVEIAVMQDLGYKIDRKAYFGRSIYTRGENIINTQGYFARNKDGTAYLDNTYSDVNLGIGLHIHGSNNTVTQAANILTKGIGATGIRVDGADTELTIPANTEIHADGYRGNGVLIAYGSGQNVEQAGTVTATGDGGTAMRFDFGSSSNGALDEYRGSYIRYKRAVAGYNTLDPSISGTIVKADNLPLTKMNADLYNSNSQELNGALVENYNLSGTLVGKENAIYIGKNAFVKNININNGASIQGNITSNWKHFGDEAFEGAYDGDDKNRDVLRIQYNNKFEKNGYEYSKYIPDLVTNLNFNSNISYNGNITGKDNMKLNVNGGTLNYGGTANVVNVNVAKGAQLYGGTYTVNDMLGKIAKDFKDDTTGQFINHGVIGANSATSNMTIKGTLVSDGILRGYGGGSKGKIDVDGVANIDGSVVTVTNALPKENLQVLNANNIVGNVSNIAGSPYAATGMLNTTGKVEGNAVTVQTEVANNLGDTTSDQLETYDAMKHMFEHLSATGDSRVNEMRTLYSMDNNEAKEALTVLSSSPVPNTMNLIQRNTMNSHIISSRLNEAFAKKDVEVAVPSAGLNTNDSGKNPTMKMKLEQPVDNDFWFKTARNWGEGTGSSYYQGTTIAGGWDRAYGKNWRAGIFVSHGSFSFADNLSHDNIKDTRLGLYGGYSKGPHSGYVYLDYGWQKNDLTRRLTGLRLQHAQANYNSRILELGGEYKYDLNAKNMKVWHISPYANIQLSQLWQDGYTEGGAGINGHRVESKSNTYFA